MPAAPVKALCSYANGFLEHRPHRSNALLPSVSFDGTPPQIVTAFGLRKPGSAPAGPRGIRKHGASPMNWDVMQRGKMQGLLFEKWGASSFVCGLPS